MIVYYDRVAEHKTKKIMQSTVTINPLKIYKYEKKHLSFLNHNFFQSCQNEQKKDSDTLSSTTTKYETYHYSGFTKEEIYAFHKHIYEGGDWTVYGDTERYFYLNFSEIKQHSRILRSNTPKILKETPRDDVKNFLTTTDLKKGGGLSLNDYIQQVEVNGLIIIHKGKIVFEGYPKMFPTDLHINMLIIQVFVSSSVAILEDRGLIDTSKPIDYYFEALKNSGWEGVPVIDILNMSSGIEWALTNNYEVSFDPIKDLATLKSLKPSGTEYQFSNADASLLTLLVEKISGLTFRDFIDQEIWRKIGAENSALLGINTNGTSISYADGMSTTLRDLARFGLAFTPSGRKGTNPIISDAHLFKIRDVNKNLNKSQDLEEKNIAVINGTQYMKMAISIKVHMGVKAFIYRQRKIWLWDFLGRPILIVKAINFISFLDSFPNQDCLISIKTTYKILRQISKSKQTTIN